MWLGHINENSGAIHCFAGQGGLSVVTSCTQELGHKPFKYILNKYSLVKWVRKLLEKQSFWIVFNTGSWDDVPM